MTTESRERRSESAETTIVYVDDDRRTAENVIAALREELPAAAIRHVDGVAQLLQSGLDDVDCLVSAAQLADTPGVNFVRAVREVSAAVPVLLYGDPDSPAEITAAFDAGATDYLQRVGESAPSALARKVAAIVNATDSGAGGGSGAAPSAESPPTDEYRVIAQVASDAIVTVDDRSRIHYANPAVEDVFGYEPDEIVGEQLTALMPDDTVEPHLEALRQYVETGERTIDWSYLELPGERKDGTEIPLSVSFGEFERDGEQFFAGIMRDISDRKALAADLREERNLNQRIVETSPIGIVTLDADGEFRFANERAEEILGRSAEQIEELSHDDGDWDLVDADGDPLPSDRTAFGRIVENGEAVYNVEMGIRRPDGERAWLSVNGQPLTEGDEIAGAVATIQDVTERRRLAGELQEVYGRVTDAFYALDDQWRFTHANERAEELIDYRGEGLVGKRIWDVFEWAEDSKLGAEYREAMATQEPSSFELYYPEPLESWYEIHVYPSETGLSVYFNDITERKERERELEETRRRYRTLVEHFPNGAVALVDPEMRYITFGGTLEGGADLSREEIEGAFVRDVLPDELADAVVPGYESAFDGETVRYEETVNDRRYQFNFEPVRDDDDEVFAAMGMSQDVTEHRRRKRELQEERDLNRHIVETSPVGIVRLDDEGVVQNANDRAEEILDRSVDDLDDLDKRFETLDPVLPGGESIEGRQLPTRRVAVEGDEIDGVEIGVLDPDEERIWLSMSGTPLRDNDGTVAGAVVTFADVTDRKVREAALEEFAKQQQTLSQLRREALEGEDLDELFDLTTQQLSDVLDHEYAKILELEEGGDELWLRSGVGWREGVVGSATVDTRKNSQAGYTLQTSAPVVVEDLESETRFTGPELLTDHGVSGGISVIIGPRDNPWGVLGTHTTDDREYDDYEVEFVQHVADLLTTAIERERHESQIGALSDVTRVLMELESPEDVCDVVADAAAADLDLPIATVAMYDEGDGRLRPAAATPLGEQLGEQTELFDVASGLAWEAFVNDDRRTDAPNRRIELSNEPVHLRERIALPLGKHGVLLVGIAGEGTMPEPQIDFVETVAATVRAALDRADREETLRDREAALQRQNEDLERLARLNEVVRGIERVLVGAATRSEIEAAVCEQLATVEPYELAWIGQPDGDGDVQRIAAAGETAYLDDVALTDAAGDDPEPSLAAAEAGEVRVAERVHAEPPLSGWRQAALRHGLSSAVAVPIEYGGYRYGVLTVYGSRTTLFDERERETLVDLGDTIAYAINAVESKRALVGDEVVELELELYDPDAFVFQFLAETGGQFTFENVFLQDGRGLRTLFSATDVTAEEIRDYAERSPFVEELRRITDDDPPLFECTLTESGFIPRLFDHGARPQQLTATAEGAEIVVELPATVDVRGFVEMLETLFEHVELLARRERTLETRSHREFQAELDAALTDRQREVLRSAYFGGFFETPRQRTGEEIGASLDISQPTFNHHLRAAQRKLFELLYGSADAGAQSE